MTLTKKQRGVLKVERQKKKKRRGLSSVTLKIRKKRQVLKKMKRENKSDTDRLSNLPDHILMHIIEFMDLKQSVQTCVLSKRWKSLWKSLINLTFYHEGEKIDIFSKSVSQVLCGRDHSLPLHKLKYLHLIAMDKMKYLSLDPKKIGYVDSPKPTLLEVLKYAVSHNVQQLTIYAGLRLSNDLILPPSIFHCYSLTYLKLNFCHPHLHDRSKIIFPKSLNLPLLKTLHLVYLTFTTNENGVVEPFSTCNMLSTLVILRCSLPDDAQALCISNSNVSSMTIGARCMYAGAHTNYKVLFCTPKLTSLTINGRSSFLTSSKFNPLFLEEGNIGYLAVYEGVEDSAVISWLNLFANVKIMTLNFSTLDTILMVLKKNGSMSNQPPCFGRLISLKVDFEPDTMIENVIDMVTYLLKNSPFQPRLDIIMKGSITFRKLRKTKNRKSKSKCS